MEEVKKINEGKRINRRLEKFIENASSNTNELVIKTIESLRNGNRENVVQLLRNFKWKERKDDDPIWNEEITIFKIVIEEYMKNSTSQYLIISHSHQAPEEIKRIVKNNPSKSYFLFVEFTGPVSMGHWFLNVLDTNTKQIFIFNSLPGYEPGAFLCLKAFSEYQVNRVGGLKKQTGLTCGYWSLYFMLLLFVGKVPLFSFNDFFEDVSDKFSVVKDIINSLFAEAYNVYHNTKEKRNPRLSEKNSF